MVSFTFSFSPHFPSSDTVPLYSSSFPTPFPLPLSSSLFSQMPCVWIDYCQFLTEQNKITIELDELLIAHYVPFPAHNTRGYGHCTLSFSDNIIYQRLPSVCLSLCLSVSLSVCLSLCVCLSHTHTHTHTYLSITLSLGVIPLVHCSKDTQKFYGKVSACHILCKVCTYYMYICLKLMSILDNCICINVFLCFYYLYYVHVHV